MTVCFNLIEHAVFQGRGNTDHQLYGMLFSQFHPGPYRVSFVLGEYTIGGTGVCTGIQKKHPINTVPARDYTLCELRSTLGGVPGNGG